MQRLTAASLLAVLVASALACGSAVLGAAPASARGSSVHITRSLSASTVIAGDATTLSGRVTPVHAGVVVSLLRRSGPTWPRLATTTTDRAGHYAFVLHPTSAHDYRLSVPTHHHTSRHVSGTTSVGVRTCTRMTRPASRVQAWFSRPGVTHLSDTATKISHVVCAAAPGARIHIAMYFVRSGDRDADAILSALATVARYRHVSVTVLMEGKLYAKSSPLYPTLRDLARFATVRTCSYGCHNRRSEKGVANPSIMHDKFITVSDTVWRDRPDPLVVFSSANWSQSQLARRWQSSVMEYDDPTLNLAVGAEWGTLTTCASSTGCAGWDARLADLGLSPRHFGIEETGDLWHGVHARHAGGEGRGDSVVFSPVAVRDPLATALNAYTCTPAHHTVRLAHMFVTASRHRLISALAGLKARGCDVRVDVSEPSVRTQTRGIAALRGAGLPVSCVRYLHDKEVLVDAVRTSDGVPDQSVWMGSQSLGGNALRSNDEAMFRLRTATATGAASGENRAVFDAYRAHWSTIDSYRRTCAITPDGELGELSDSLTADPHDTVLPQ